MFKLWKLIVLKGLFLENQIAIPNQSPLIENDDEKIFPDMSNLLPKLREFIDENTTVIDNHYPNTQPSEDLNFDE
uniref:Uncharacterized protein n=1 Tax=Trichobilharzia regenti TaxID=157069 RepID=A0AA85K7S1_TRIRE|nr:unnamed protein product [Trichobilharzia regenti]